MELYGAIFLILALAIVVGLFIGRPFLEGTRVFPKAQSKARTASEEREHQRSALLAERDRVLTALQELDFDYALGKVPAEEYPQMRAELLKNGADVLRKLDEIAAEAGSAQAATGEAEDRIEAAVAARRADASARKASQPSDGAADAAADAGAAVAVAANGKSHGARNDEIEEMVALRKRERKESTGGFCPHCGKPVQKSDRFCSKCGATL